MISKAATPAEYLKELPEDRKEAVSRFRDIISKNLQKGFEERMNYGMICYVIPHSVYPAGYHCDPKQPLPFICIASQKNFISLYHMGLYSEGNLAKWLQVEWPEYSSKKLDMGKGCVRFKKTGEIPFDLIKELIQKMSPMQWIEVYEEKFKR